MACLIRDTASALSWGQRCGLCGQARDLPSSKASRRWKLFIAEQSLRFSLLGRPHLIDTAVMAYGLLTQLIVNERFDEQIKGLLGWLLVFSIAEGQHFAKGKIKVLLALRSFK